MNPKTFIFFGRSGSGKGTQAKLLIEHLEKNSDKKALYIGTGVGLRELVKRDSHTGVLTKEIFEKGGLMPEFLPIWVWSEFLIENFTGEEHLIFDGTTRRLPEADVLDSAIKFYKIKNPYVIHINVSREKATEMMKARGRKDDTEDSIKARLDWFEKDVVPPMEYFKNSEHYTFLDINGEQSIEDVHKDILEKIDQS